MAISINLGTASSTAKISDINTAIAAINAELTRLEALIPTGYATKKDLDALAARVGTIEQTPLSDHGHTALAGRVDELEADVAALEASPPPPTTTTPAAGTPVLAKPAGLNPEKIEIVYDQATLYYHDLVMYARRVDENQWRLQATLNYIVVNPAVWTYDETVEGTPEQVYEHAMKRMEELAKLKPQHDAVHDRVRRMSQGEN